jgi:rhomboid protease GluP
MGEKIRVVVLPMIAVMLGAAALLALLNWVLVLHTGWLPLDEDVAALWLPLAVALAAVGFLIAPRLHILAFNPKKNIGGLYVVAAIIFVAGPAILVQEYLQATTGEMVTVADAAAIGQHPNARFFTVGSVCLNKHKVPWHPRVSVSGDNDENLDVDLYYAIPFCGTRVWLGLQWQRTFDNRLSDKEKDALFRVFLKDADKDLRAFDPHAVHYYERVGRNSQRRALTKALTDFKHDATAPIFVVAHKEPFAVQGEGWLGGALIAFVTAAALWLLMVSVVPLKPVAERVPTPPGGLTAMLVPHRDAFALPLLVDMNLLVYAAMVFSGLGFLNFEVDDLIDWGASFGKLDHGFGLVRLITATFVHGGIFHILGNMYGLLIGGALLSPVARNTRLLFIYLVSGLGGSVLSVTMHPDIVVVGASGAIFGLFGALIALAGLRDPKILAFRRAVLVNAGIFVVFNAIYGATTPGVDNFAHIGGFLTGLVCGGMIYVIDRREARVTA